MREDARRCNNAHLTGAEKRAIYILIHILLDAYVIHVVKIAVLTCV